MPKEKHGPLIDLRNELHDLFNEVQKLSNDALNESIELIKNRMAQNTPERTGATKKMWTAETKYWQVKYLWNDELSESNIPVVNLLEFGSKGKPFAISTFRDCLDEVSEKIVNNMNKVK